MSTLQKAGPLPKPNSSTQKRDQNDTNKNCAANNNNSNNNSCQTNSSTNKKSTPGKPFVLMTHASFRSAGYSLMVEDKPDQKIQSKRKTGAPLAFFCPVQLKMSSYSKELLAVYMEILEFAQILLEATKLTVVLTDNRSVTRFFKT